MSVSVDAVLPLAEALLAPGKVEAPTENKARRLGLNYGVEDVTGPGKVRQVIAKAGVDYKVTESATLGAETGRTIHDPQDAAAWKKTVEEENIATVKYRMSF